MKELYLNAEMDVVEFDAMDVIATSNTEGGEDPVVSEEATTTFVPANNEGPPAFDAWS